MKARDFRLDEVESGRVSEGLRLNFQQIFKSTYFNSSPPGVYSSFNHLSFVTEHFDLMSTTKPPSVTTRAASISAKLASMAAATTSELSNPGLMDVGAACGDYSDPVTKSDLEALFNKQRDSFKADMAILIQQLNP